MSSKFPSLLILCSMIVCKTNGLVLHYVVGPECPHPASSQICLPTNKISKLLATGICSDVDTIPLAPERPFVAKGGAGHLTICSEQSEYYHLPTLVALCTMWFQYPERLNKDSSRIFTLESGEKQDEIQGSLKTHRLDAAPEYEALSYEWGSKTESTSMKCNKYDFKVTKSLDITLRRLRLTDRPRPLWIDQICINQESNDERSAQVSIMRLIYSNAIMVTAWLGQADTEAANSVKDLLAAFANMREDYACGMSHFPDDEDLARLGLPLRHSRVWTDLDLMLSASYFSRVWIIQELAISSRFRLLWGDITISEDEYDSLTHKMFFLCLTEPDAVEGCPRINWHPVSMNLFGKREWKDKDLLELVRFASRSKATIPQDKIYALVGLAGQHHYNVNPDYTKPESEVFADFAVRVISTKGNLDILDRAYVEDPNEPKHFPLWAPRWQPEDSVAGFVSGKFKASKDTKTITKLSSNAKVLELRGLEVGVVLDVHPNQRPESNQVRELNQRPVSSRVQESNRVPELHYSVVAALKMVRNHNVPFEQTYKMDAIKVILLTMMAGRKRDVLWLPTLERLEDESHLDDFITFSAATMLQIMLSIGYDAELFDLIQIALEARGPVPEDEPQIEPTSEEQLGLEQIRRRYPNNPEYLSTAQDLLMLCKPAQKVRDCLSFVQSISISRDQNFFITDKGYVGIGPRCMKAGDKVCVLFGGSTPYAIRQKSATDEYFYLGSVYIHGIMDGEIIDAWEKDKDSDNQKFQERLFKLL
ncbi:uncharacterized protein FIESC28_09929 [Fusarium coffeatum]|uniref:Heterokaryon incompatibility domain-containing protein n=1 Tax=Fusarium coffeatum TaxID=231269 RepID=A0A366QWP0_9HYPO|nr:uncharacterized protein FIESC28_09929 [Fusarium coffeatum]RBR09321.1 hypothetical protein FIESC28_09929 [Fusarium coffeatum]